MLFLKALGKLGQARGDVIRGCSAGGARRALAEFCGPRSRTAALCCLGNWPGSGCPGALRCSTRGRGTRRSLTSRSVGLGQALGAAAAPVFLAAVASGSDSFAVEVAGRLAELREIAARAAVATCHADSPGGDALVASIPIANSPLSGGGSAAAGPDTASPAALPALMARTEELTELGTALADRVRVAVAGVAAGFPAALVGRELTEWSGAVEDHLAAAAQVVAASDLVTLSTRLTEIAARAEADRKAALERERATKDALRASRLLHEQGLDGLIPGMPREAGFDTPEDAGRPCPRHARTARGQCSRDRR